MSTKVDYVDLLVFGSAIVDFICYVPRIPKVGETLIGDKFATGFGGKGANQCIAAAKLGAKVAIIAKVGDDSWGRDYIKNFERQKVNIDFTETVSGQTTGVAQITVAKNGDNQIVIVTGANNLLSTDDVIKASNLFENAKILICQLETPIEPTKFALKSFKGISILNGAPAIENLNQDFLKYSTIFCVNEIEASLMTQQVISSLEDAKKAIRKLIEMGGNTVIVTLGEQGTAYGIKGEKFIIYVKPFKVPKVVDTTGAGDCFIGSLGYFLARYPKKPLHQQIGAANKVAAISVQFPGTQASFPSIDDIDIDFSKNNFEWSSI